MSFEAIEDSRDRGLPIQLYKFTIGTVAYCYTDCDISNITFNGDVYIRHPIDRDAIQQSGTLDNQTISIDMPITVDFSPLFLASAPTQVVSAQIYTGHENDPDGQFISIFVGRVVSVNRQDNVLKVMCETTITKMNKMNLRRYWQTTCCHNLFDSNCGVSKQNFTLTSVVSTVSATGITLPKNWNGNLDTSMYQGGMMWWGNEVRSILQVMGDRIILSGLNSTVPIGQPVSIAPGCPKTLGVCTAQYNNAQNFGGQPWIPVDNPTANTNYFY